MTTFAAGGIENFLLKSQEYYWKEQTKKLKLTILVNVGVSGATYCCFRTNLNFVVALSGLEAESLFSIVFVVNQ